jgi:hypothetical protein
MTGHLLLLVPLVACGPQSRGPAPTAEPATAATAATHPGTITLVDLDEGTSREEPVSAVPESLAWVVVDGEKVAVTRIESRQRPDGSREIIKRAADGTSLEVTVSAPRPPR